MLHGEAVAIVEKLLKDDSVGLTEAEERAIEKILSAQEDRIKLVLDRIDSLMARFGDIEKKINDIADEVRPLDFGDVPISSVLDGKAWNI